MRIVVIGHAQSGKDTVAKILSKKYGLKYVNNSKIFAEKIIMPLMKYSCVEECYADRVNNRQFWFDTLNGLLDNDIDSLSKLVFDKYDIRCGVRSIKEIARLKEHRLSVIWVERSNNPKKDSTCGVSEEHANIRLINHGSYDDLIRYVSDKDVLDTNGSEIITRNFSSTGC
jgi:gluconate kinase